MDFNEDIELINQFHINAGHSKNTIKTYKTAFNKYRNFHKMSLKELLNEAIKEQEMNVPINQLNIYNRINLFKQYLIENHIGNTISSTLQMIKTFYKHNRVELPYFPPLNRKTIKHHKFINYGDLLSKEEILKGLRISNDELKSWIMVMVSSGATRVECKQLTNETLFRGTLQDHQKDNVLDAFKYLSRHDNVVCTCELIRKKTMKPYYTFLNPETVQHIAQHKLNIGDIKPENPLLRYSEDYVGKKCREINEYLQFGHAGGYTRFRPHMFRKFNATHLHQGFKEKLSMDEIDQLQGRGKNSTRQSYYKNNPEILKLNYIQAMNNISLYNRYKYRINDRKIMIETLY